MREQRTRIVENNDVKIAVLEEQMRTMQRHLENIEKQIESHMKISAKQNEDIMGTLNKGKGAFTFAVIVAGAIGAIITVVGKALFSRV
jgi:hypothetical protein